MSEPHTFTPAAEIYADSLRRIRTEFRRSEVIWMSKNLDRDTTLKAVERYAKGGAKDGNELMEFAKVMTS